MILDVDWWIRKAVTWGTWIAIYYIFVPAAKRRGINHWKWFWLGTLAMWGTFAGAVIIGMGAIMMLPDFQSPDGTLSPEAMNQIVMLFPIGYVLGWLVMGWLARKLKSLPIVVSGKAVEGGSSGDAQS